MIALKLELCLVLTLYLITLHRVASQCQEFDISPMDTFTLFNSMTCLTCDYPDQNNEEWLRDGTLIPPGREAESCDCVVFPHEGKICFNSEDVGVYNCEVLVGFGLLPCLSSAAILTFARSLHYC